jgi:hypothetical protein
MINPQGLFKSTPRTAKQVWLINKMALANDAQTVSQIAEKVLLNSPTSTDNIPVALANIIETHGSALRYSEQMIVNVTPLSGMVRGLHHSIDEPHTVWLKGFRPGRFVRLDFWLFIRQLKKLDNTTGREQLMKTKGYFHLLVTSFVLMCAVALTAKGFALTEHTRLLLSDTGIVPAMYVELIAFAIPLALGISALTAYFGITSLLPVVVGFSIHIALLGLALYQGLHFDCGCYLPGSVQSDVYSTLKPQFLIMLLVLLVSAALYYFNNLATHRSMTPTV